MTPLHNIQKDRGCTVGPGCVGGECSCRRTVRLVLEGMREPDTEMGLAGAAEVNKQMRGSGSPADFHAATDSFRAMIDTVLKEVG